VGLGGSIVAWLRLALPRGGESRCEAAQVRLHGLAVGTDGGLIVFDRHRQTAAGRDCAEHHRIDHRAGATRHGIHVEQHRIACVLRDFADELVGIEPAVAHGHLLGDAVGAMGRGDRQRAIGRDEAGGDGAAGFQQLARHHDVDVADARRQRQHRAQCAELAPGHREHFDVIGGGAGALGDAGDRGALHRQAAARRCRDDPIGEHAAAFAAERRDQQGDGARGHGTFLRAHAGLSRAAPPTKPMTRRRSAATMRSHRVGLRISSAR
jgi:hypothetical protein